MKFGLFFIFFFILLSCAQQTKPHRPTTTKLTPPKINFNANGDLESIDTFLQKKARHLNSPETVLSYEWWSRYQRARLWEKKNPKLSCQLFRELSQDHHFPLKDLAALRAVQICTLTQSEQVSLPSETYDHYPDWLHPLAIESFLIKSKKENNISQQIQLLIKRSKWSRQRKEKIAFTLKALHLTSSLKDLQEAKKLKQELIQRRDMLAPRFIKKAHTKDYLKIAYDFRRNRNFPKAKKFYSRLLRKKVSDKTKIKAFNGLRQTYKIERKLNKYLLTTERMAMFLKRRYRSAKRKWKSYFNGLYTLARTYWTLGKKNKAKKSLRLAQKFSNKKSMANVHFVTGRMHEEDGNFQHAITFFNKALNEPEVSSSLKEKLTWYKAWNLKKLKNYNQSIKILEQLAQDTEEQNAKSKYLFWWAHTAALLKQTKKAQSLYTQTIEHNPLSYYSLLAHRELRRPLKLSTTKQPTPSLHHDTFLEKELDVNYLKWLIATNEENVAKRYLDFQAQEFRKTQSRYSKDIIEKTWLAFFHYYAQAGDYLGLYYQLGRLSSNEKEQILARHPDLLFPRPFHESVTQASQQFGINSEIIYSIMRQESAFNPRARSHMDAFGLMQLLPKVARETATKSHLPIEHDDDLFLPHINIPIGTAHLRDLWEQHDGRFILMTASYNASAEAILNWMKTRFRGDALEFIEDIPYNETQNYVKLIMRNLIFYQALKSHTPILFPEWVLEL